MKLRTKFIFFISILHVIIVLLSLRLLQEYKILFVAVEMLLLISITVSVYLYKSFIRPINLISAGIETIKDKDFNTKFLKVGQMEMDNLIEVYNKMIDELRSERIKIKEQHYFLTKLIEASPSGIIILDFENRISHLNPAALSILRLDEKYAVGKSLSRLPGLLAHELNKIGGNESIIVNVDGLRSYRCGKSHFLDRGFRHQFILIEELTEEIMKAEKRAYGKVIRMMSHEISNTIGAINSILNSSLNYGDQLVTDDRNDFTNAIQVAIDRNQRLNQFMSNFSDVVRIPSPVKEPHDLIRLLKGVKTLMDPECEQNNINLQIESSKPQLTIEMDVRQMEQILVNAIKNSIEAIDQNGTIILKASSAPIKSLIIRDNGKGIPVEERKNIFTPFFSSKKNGQGIGLTVIREILLNHGFEFSLESKPDGFTDLTIRFGHGNDDLISKE